MYIIGENIHIISPRVKEALANRDKRFFQELALQQVEAGASALDLNIGRQKREGPEIMTWLVNTIQEVVDIPFSLDTTNLAAIEAGLKVAKQQCIINSVSAEPERLEQVPLVAKEYDARLIALTMGTSGIPVASEARVSIALESILPRADEIGLPYDNLLIDPLVLTVSGCQEFVPECIEAVRILRAMMDPPLHVNIGLSNVSNQVPREGRALINRVHMVMQMAAGLDFVIADPLDEELNLFIRAVETRDESTPLKRLILKLYDDTEVGETLEPEDVDQDDPEQVAIYKTVQVLLNKVIYADAYLEV